MTYGNTFQRNAQRKIRFEGTYHSPGGELIRYRGIVVNIGGGAIWSIDEVKGVLAGSNKPAGRTLDASRFSAPSFETLKYKLSSVLRGLQVYKDMDPLRAEMERDQHERNRGSAHTERTISREPVPAPDSKKIFGLDPNDSAGLGKLFDTVFYAWALENKDTAEFSDKGKTPEQIAQAQRNLQQNIASMTELLMHWAKTGQITVLSLQEVRDAAAFLKQRHHWFGQRKRGEPLARPFVAPREEPAEEPAEVDPRKLSFEALQKIERERQQKVRREKNLTNVRNGLGVVI